MAKEVELPFSGGVLQQPELLMQMFDVIYDEYSQVREDNTRRAEQEAKRKAESSSSSKGWSRFLRR